jgi:glutaredoxin
MPASLGRFRGGLAGGLPWAALACLAAFACRANPGAGGDGSQPAAAAASAPALPPLVLKDDTPNLLLTWVGAEGDFHVAEQIAQVPEESRKQVRVVITDQPAGSGASVYVADLTTKNADGSYPVATLSRADWDKIGADRRKTRMEALAPAQPGSRDASKGTAGTSGAGAMPDGDGSASDGAGSVAAVTAIIYGADWCKPCHEAERYLKSLGVAVTKKNIEESRSAQAEMREKLSRVNRQDGSIPVIDVMGRIFVGYAPGPLKQAVDAARRNVQKHG